MKETIRFTQISKRLSNFSMTYEAPFEFEGLVYPTFRHLAYATRYTRLDTYIRNGVKVGIKAVVCDMTLQELNNMYDYPITNKEYHKEVYENVKKAIKIRITEDETGMLLQELLDTGDAVLIYSSPFDSYWSTGTNRSGVNRLGCILEEVRKEYREAIAKEL